MKRYAVYYTPPKGTLAEFGATWLGWDIAAGTKRPHPVLADLPLPPPISLSQITRAPRKYGFHGTIKPPFYLAKGNSQSRLADALRALCKELAPVHTDGLNLAKLGRYFALTATNRPQSLQALASRVVIELDRFRAPLSAEDLAYRRKANLSAHHDALLVAWGYPYVLDAFRFHMTLTGALPHDHADAVFKLLEPIIDGLPTAPFCLDALTLVGEDDAGNFCEIDQFRLTG